MNEVIIHECPICGKSARAIDKREEACDDLIKCDGNETYTCYTSKKNKEWRFIARRSKPIRPNFDNCIVKPFELTYVKKVWKQKIT